MISSQVRLMPGREGDGQRAGEDDEDRRATQ